jgi:hypothetical protein
MDTDQELIVVDDDNEIDAALEAELNSQLEQHLSSVDANDFYESTQSQSQPGPSAPALATSASTAQASTTPQLRGSIRIRNNSIAAAQMPPPNPPSTSGSQPQTRSSAPKLKAQPKSFKLKLSDKAMAQAPTTSFLGSYDRELDSDTEKELEFEEQFILRMPPGEDCDKLRAMVTSRNISPDVWFKFKGNYSSDITPHSFIFLARFATRTIPHRRHHLFIQTGRPTLHNRSSNDIRQ